MKATHIYTGRDTAWGLLKDTPVAISHGTYPGMAGLKMVARVSDGKLFKVSKLHLRPV